MYINARIRVYYTVFIIKLNIMHDKLVEDMIKTITEEVG